MDNAAKVMKKLYNQTRKLSKTEEAATHLNDFCILLDNYGTPQAKEAVTLQQIQEKTTSESSHPRQIS